MMRAETTRRIVRLLAIVSALAVEASGAAAQDVPTVFVHGLKGDAGSWRNTADRLAQQVRITTQVPTLDWRDWYENQGRSLQSRFASLPASTIAVGHSNGGIVAREWSKWRPLRSIVTLGTPHEGAFLAQRALDIVHVNQQLFGSVNFLISVLGGAPNEFTWMWPFLSGSMGGVASLSSSTVAELAATLGVATGVPVLGQMAPESAYLKQLNAPPNLAREASAVAQRVGLVFVARDYWRAGIAVALAPEYQDYVAQTTQVAIVLFDAAAAYLRSNYPPWNSTAQTLLSYFQFASSKLRELDPYWCWAVTNDFSCATSHDGVVPTPSQFFPQGINLGFIGPAHIREIAWSPDALRDVFTNTLRVQLRTAGGSSTPSAPSGPGPWSLVAGQQLLPDRELTSRDGSHVLRYQSDGNLVIYQRGGSSLWSSQTSGHSAGRLEMHGDGNLVIYNASGAPVWSSDTWRFPGAYASILDSGHLVIVDSTGVPIWWSGGE
jgi:pimeloyl-ACP methyl ester carboxylesterase